MLMAAVGAWAAMPMVNRMEKINLSFFYNLGAKLGLLAHARTDLHWMRTLQFLAWDARGWVENVLTGVAGLPVSQTEGRDLIEAIDKCQTWDVPNLDQLATGPEYIDAATLVLAATKFETILAAALQELPTYLAMPKGIYSTRLLIEQAENMFTESLRRKLPNQVKDEIRECGRCLAFNNSTAAGFHMMRATELTMHEYLLKVCTPTPRPAARLKTWAHYVKAFNDSGSEGAKKIAAIIDSIRADDRNLIMHPDKILTPDDAFVLVDVGKGAIVAMADQMP